MERTLQQLSSEERFQLFLDAASDYAIFFMDDTGQIIEWSSGAQKVLGFSEEEALRMNGRDIFTPEDRAKHADEHEMEVAVREGQANDERWHLRNGGARFFGVGRLVALKDDGGNVYGFTKIIRDATPHKNLEQALQASDSHFRTTFAQAPLGMVLTDLEGRIQDVNAAFCRLTGRQDSALRGRTLLDFTHPDDRPKEREQIQEVLSGRASSAVVEKRLQKADGSIVWVQNSAAILRDAEGRLLSMIDLCQDISVLKLSAAELERLVEQRTAALKAKSSQMESFCYTVAHDLRAPLRGIAGYAEIMRTEFGLNIGPVGLEYLDKIEASAKRMDELIKDLLGYTRVQQVTIAREEVDLTEIAERVVDQIKVENGDRDLEIEVSGALGIVCGDRVILDRVFHNLLSNAMKFHRPGVSPTIRIFAQDTPRRKRIWVEDNGVGVDPRHRERVFGIFERLHSEREFPGTGVGLAIVATAMQRLGGSQGVEPNQPFGSRFWIEFPQVGQMSQKSE